MDAFTIEIAGFAVRVEPLFQSTIEYCRPYLSNREPELIVSVTAEDLSVEQQLLAQEAEEEGLKIRKFKDPFLERSVIQRRVADYLTSRNVLMMHGSTVSLDGEAYLFTAPCGTGKSTHTRLWRDVFGDRAIMVNDDKPFLRITSGDVLAYGSPWSGKHGLATNICVPLKGICLLHRGKENRIDRVERDAEREFLVHQLHTPSDDSLMLRSLELLNVLLDGVPLWQMECNKDPEAALVSYLAMKNGKCMFRWLDYDDQYAQLVDSWLDEETVSMTGLGVSWGEYWQAVKEDAVNFPGCEDYCKVIFVGNLCCAVICFGTFRNTLTISEIVVNPKLRGHRIATRLLSELVDMAKNHAFGDLDRLSAVIYPQNVISLRAFQNAGFRPEGKTDDGVDWVYSYIL